MAYRSANKLLESYLCVAYRVPKGMYLMPEGQLLLWSSLTSAPLLPICSCRENIATRPTFLCGCFVARLGGDCWSCGAGLQQLLVAQSREQVSAACVSGRDNELRIAE